MSAEESIKQLREVTARLISSPAKDSVPSFDILFKLIEQSPASIILTDREARIVYVNSKFTKITGYSFDEVLGKNPRILKSGEFPTESYKILWDTITTGKEWRGEFHNRRKDGTSFWESASIAPLFSPEGEITHFVAVKEDITDLKIQIELIRRSKEMYKAVYDNAPIAFVIWNHEFIVTDWNRQAEELFGWKAEEVIGRNFFDFLVPQDDREGVKLYVAQLMKKMEISHRHVNYNCTKSGKLIQCEWYNAPLHNREGQVASIISLGNEI